MTNKMGISSRMALLTLGVALLIVMIGIFIVFLRENQVSNMPIRVACIGDSLTAITNYPKYLQILLGNRFKVEPFGVVGATVLLNTDRPFLNQTAFREVSNFDPQIIVIMLGTNDARTNIFQSIQNFDPDFKLLIEEFRNQDHNPKIWIALPPPIFNNTLGLEGSNFANVIIPNIKQVAEELNLQTIDIYSALIKHPEYFEDGVHPNNDGAIIIARTVFMKLGSSK